MRAARREKRRTPKILSLRPRPAYGRKKGGSRDSVAREPPGLRNADERPAPAPSLTGIWCRGARHSKLPSEHEAPSASNRVAIRRGTSMGFCDHCEGQRFDRAQVLRLLRATRRTLEKERGTSNSTDTLDRAIQAVRALEIPHLEHLEDLPGGELVH